MIDYDKIRAQIKDTLEQTGMFWELYPDGMITDKDCERFWTSLHQTGKTETSTKYQELKEKYIASTIVSTKIRGKTKDNLIYDDLMIPPEISEAARLLENFWTKQRIKQWEFMGICSRNHAWELENWKKATEVFSKRREAAYMNKDDFYQSMIQMHYMFEDLLKKKELNIPEDIYTAYSIMIKNKDKNL